MNLRATALARRIVLGGLCSVDRQECLCHGFLPLCLERSGPETSQMQRAETSSWIRYAWVRRWGSVLRSKDSRYGFGALALWPKPVPGSATLGLGAGVLCCGLKTRATLWCYGSVVETSSWLRYTWARRWGSVLRSKDSRYGFGALALWPKPWGSGVIVSSGL
ncbi:Unannotated [Lentimonas sp. CC4]|nr:Unannotated [Lentimonas sp. CC4]